MSILYFILVLFVIVLVHEWGHYKTAKFFGARVDEFGFGYPPKIATLFKRGETTFTLNALPFGGFVKIYGEDAVEGGDVSRALFNKPKWQQAIVLSAGVCMNVVLAWIIFLGLFLGNSPVIGSLVPQKYIHNQRLVITDVLPKSSALTAGLQKGDVIVSVKTLQDNDILINSSELFTDLIQNSAGQPVRIVTNRSGETIPRTLIPVQMTPEGPYKAGLGLNLTSDVKVPIAQAFVLSFKVVFQIIGDIFNGLFQLVKNLFGFDTGSTIHVSGPIGIIKTVGDASRFGFSYLLSLTALISLNLAVLNILPIPALDGGRLFFLLIEKIKGKAINSKTATVIHTTSFIILVGLMLILTFFDVFKLFGK